MMSRSAILENPLSAVISGMFFTIQVAAIIASASLSEYFFFKSITAIFKDECQSKSLQSLKIPFISSSSVLVRFLYLTFQSQLQTKSQI